MKRAVTFYYDQFSGELSKVDFAPGFLAESALMKADVLKDLAGEAVDAYNNSIEGEGGLMEWLESLKPENADLTEA